MHSFAAVHPLAGLALGRFNIKVLYIVSLKLQARFGRNLSFNDTAAMASR